MFGNFIYFIVVLLIYLTYQPSEETGLGGLETFLFFLALTLVFGGCVRLIFKRLGARLGTLALTQSDSLYHSALVRCSVLAVVVFAIDIYGLGLPSFVNDLPLLDRVPTLQALVFLLLFIGLLSMVWGFAFDAYQRLYQPEFTRRDYIASNISFAAPVLLPWLLISFITDLISALPSSAPKAFLATTEGQILYFLIFLLAFAVVGPTMIKTFWRCTPLEDSPQRTQIDRLCRRAGMAYADILRWPLFGGKMITAGVMGLVRRFRYILVTPSLLVLLAADEIDAVVAHEIGHIKKKHLLFYLLFFAGYLLISYVTFDLVLYIIIFAEPIWQLVHHSGANQTMVASVIFSAMMICVFLVYFRFVFGFFMRNFERQADGYVYVLFDSAGPLISTLRKIAFTSGQPADRPNWHHYSIRERIDFLSKCEQDRAWIRRHDAKVRRGIAVYLAALVLLGAVSYQLNMGSMGSKLSDHLIETLILRQIDRMPENPSLYAILGDMQYRRNNFVEAREAYQASLGLKPDNPTVLNNLAWLLATCGDASLRDPELALALARRAAGLESSAFILDTLAECYHVNGLHAEAVEAERRAIALVRGDRSHYEAQLRKFMEAAQGG
jgi:Zn-dependent protease with chaperone function